MACACGNNHKYTCPACGTQSCSVECSKKHKSSTGCTGILDPTRYIPRGELLTVTGLDRDYNFLQKIGRDIQVEAPEFKRRARDFTRNNVKVRSMPPQMSRAKQNKSGWNRTKQCYLWTVELRTELTNGGTLTHVPDTQTIEEITGQQAATLIDADGKKIPLKGDQTLADALKDQSVVEFPTIFLGVVEESSESESESDSDTTDSSEESSDQSSDEAPEELSSKLPIVGDKAEQPDGNLGDAAIESILPEQPGGDATGDAAGDAAIESIEPPHDTSMLQITPQADPELANIIEETHAALYTEEPDSLKKTLIEEL